MAVEMLYDVLTSLCISRGWQWDDDSMGANGSMGDADVVSRLVFLDNN